MFNFSAIIPLIGVGLVLIVKEIAARRIRNPRRLPLPPGPKGLPLLGNMFELPQIVPWEGYDNLCKEYGKSPSAPGFSVCNSFLRRHDLYESVSTRNFSTWFSSPRRRSVGQESCELLRPPNHAFARYVSSFPFCHDILLLPCRCIYCFRPTGWVSTGASLECPMG